MATLPLSRTLLAGVVGTLCSCSQPLDPRFREPSTRARAWRARIFWVRALEYFSTTIIVEGGLWLLAIILYIRATRPKNHAGVYAFWPVVLSHRVDRQYPQGSPASGGSDRQFDFLLIDCSMGFLMNQARLVHKMDKYIDRSVRTRQMMMKRLALCCDRACRTGRLPVFLARAHRSNRLGAFAQSGADRGLCPERRFPFAAEIDRGGRPGSRDVARGADGFFYTGLQDGRILRFRAESNGQRSCSSIPAAGRWGCSSTSRVI